MMTCVSVSRQDIDNLQAILDAHAIPAVTVAVFGAAWKVASHDARHYVPWRRDINFRDGCPALRSRS